MDFMFLKIIMQNKITAPLLRQDGEWNIINLKDQ